MSIDDYFSDESTNLDVFLRTVSDAAQVDVTSIVISSVTSSISNSKNTRKNTKNAEKNKILLSSGSVSFMYQISGQAADENAANTWFTQTSNNLITSVSNGEFTSLLQSYSTDLNGNAFTNADASAVPVISDPTISTLPSTETSNDENESNTIAPEIISVIVILSVFVACTSTIVCYRNKGIINCEMNMKKTTKTIDFRKGSFIIYFLYTNMIIDCFLIGKDAETDGLFKRFTITFCIIY
jgi:hypothetical protein